MAKAIGRSSDETTKLHNALRAFGLPNETYASLPGLTVSPGGIPFIPLPAPRSDFCIGPPYGKSWLATHWSSDMDEDALLMADMANTRAITESPIVKEGMMGSRDVPNIPSAIWLKMTKEAMKSTERFLMNRVFRVEDVMAFDPAAASPLTVVALLDFSPYNFRRNPEPSKSQFLAKEKDLPAKEKHWAFRALVLPAYMGRGLGTAATAYIIDNWFTPYIYSFPCQLVSSYYADNVGSAKMHTRLGFHNVALSFEKKPNTLMAAAITAASANKGVAQMAEDEKLFLYCSVWKGPEGKLSPTKAETVFRDLADC